MPAGASPSSSHLGRLLFADDDEWIRESSVPLLEDLGFEVVAVEDGVEALGAFERARAEGAPFRLAVLDVRMPRLHGTDIVRQLVAADAEIRVILVSGFDRDYLDAGLFSSGRVGFVQKPAEAEDILKELAALTRG
ncbi:MAG: response regulator [Myxococcota bacterium]